MVSLDAVFTPVVTCSREGGGRRKERETDRESLRETGEKERGRDRRQRERKTGRERWEEEEKGTEKRERERFIFLPSAAFSFNRTQ